MNEERMQPWQLRQLQHIGTEHKVRRSLMRISEAYYRFDGNIYVSYSGGKDSETLLSLVWSVFPDVPAVFVDTGLEYPEIRDQVRRHGDRVVWLKPEVPFKKIIEKHGYPVISKKQAQYIREVRSAYRKGNRDSATVRLRMTGFASSGKESKMGKISDKWQYLCTAPFEISERCCQILKKNPLDAYQKQTGRVPLIGIMAADGKQREKSFLFSRCGRCNSFDGAVPTSWPLAIWTTDDVWRYLRGRSVPYSRIYDMGYDRTGCMFCMFGVHMERGENRFQKMYRTHPELWSYCMDKLGVRRVMDFIGCPVVPQDDMFSTPPCAAH